MDFSSISALHAILAAQPWLFVSLIAITGLLFGSFLNVCIARIPLGESIAHPRSYCRECSTPIAPWHNIPILSWLILRRRCARCHAAISWRYPAVEASTSILFIACFLHFGPTLIALRAAILCFLLLGLAFMDAEHFLLPDSFTLTGIAIALLLNIAIDFPAAPIRAAITTLRDASLAAAILLVVRFAYWLVRRREGMGLGDVKLLAMLAAFLGFAQSCVALFLAIITAALFALGWLLLRAIRSQTTSSQTPLALPFGCFLSLAGVAARFCGPQLLHWYLDFAGWPTAH